MKNRSITPFLIALVPATVLFAILFFAIQSTASASTNISSGATQHWAWNDVVGWIDHYNTLNVNVTATSVVGYATSSVGYISFDCANSPAGNICGSSNYKVINDGTGKLSGWAWNDNIGWISFCGVNGGGSSDCPNVGANYQVQVVSGSPNWKFIGWAWNDLVGWISFCNTGADCSGSPYAYDVETSWYATSTTATLESTTYDTGVSGGAAINSVMALGTLQGNGGVSGSGQINLQFAGSNSASGPWSYATSTTYVLSPCASAAACTPTKVDFNLNNVRYFRYKLLLYSDLSQRQTPRVDDIIVNWSP